MKSQGLREYPTGMSLAVPPILDKRTARLGGSMHGYGPPPHYTGATTPDQRDQFFKVKFDSGHNEVVFGTEKCPVRAGDWIMVTSRSGSAL
jgi:ubiquitin-conjugating enzyme E2 Q